jgi:hypothetical protein
LFSAASAILTLLARLTRARWLLLLLLARFLAAALLLTALAGLITLLLLAGLLVGILILVHSFSFQRWPSTPRPNCETNTPARQKFRIAARKQVRGTGRHRASFPLQTTTNTTEERIIMGRYFLLWLLGIPIPILVLIWMFGGLH